MLTSLIHHFLNLRKLGVIGGSLAIASTGLHYGIIKPNNNAKYSVAPIGSNPLLDKRRANPYSYSSNDFYYVENFGNRFKIPSLEPALKLTHLQSNTRDRNKTDFSREIQNFLTKNTKNPAFSWKGTSKDSYVLRNSENLRRHVEYFSLVSDMEIPYKSIFYMKKLLSLSKEELGQDLLWSLAEEASYNKSIIRPGSIKISFDIQEPSVNIDNLDQTKVYPTPARKINNFFVSFRVFNPNNSRISVFRSIFIEPLTEVDITVRLDRSELRPFSTPVRGLGHKAATWSLIPDSESSFEITISEIFPKVENKFFSQKRLNLIHGRSKFFTELISSRGTTNINDYGTINSPTYLDFKEVVTPHLVGITKEIIKKDLETWFGSVAARNFYLNIEDIKKFLNFIKTKIFFDGKGRPSSIIENFSEYPTWRSNFYTHLRLDERLIKVIDKFFDKNNKSSEKIDPNELDTLLTSLNQQLDKFQKSATVEFTWIEEPTLGIPPVNDDSPYPAVSFKFKQKYKWDKGDIKIKFKGCWDEGKNEFSESESEKDKCGNGGNGGKKWFDFSNKLDKLSSVLSPVQSLFNTSILGGIDLFSTLIPDVQEFIGWEEVVISKDESIELTWNAYNSPIRPALSPNFDTYDNNNVSYVLGWKAMDVTTTYDMSNFHKAFSSIYGKLTSYIKKGEEASLTSLTGLTGLTGKFKTSPVSLVVHLVNKLFSDSDSKKPWPEFFKSLFQNAFKLDSTQLFVGYTRAFFNVEDWVLEETEESNREKRSSEISSPKKFKVYLRERDGDDKLLWEKKTKDNKFPAKTKTLSLREILGNFHLYYSTYFPKPPLNFNFTNDEKYKNFMNREGQTSIGLVQNVDKIKILLKDYYRDKNGLYERESRAFPSDKFIDWSKVKVSFARLEIEKALKSVLALKNNFKGLAASFTGVKLPLILGEAIQRDAFWVNVNMMIEDGSVSIFSWPFVGHIKSPYSVHQFHIDPYLDKSKLELGNLKSYL